MKELSLHVLDLVENALRAGARRITISLLEDSARDLLEMVVEDDGKGMDEKTRQQALNPFFSTKGKKVGLGLPLIAQLSKQCGGSLEIASEEGKGTRVKATFRRSHIDLPPLGNLAETLFVLLASHPEVEFVFSHEVDGRRFSFNSREVFRALGTESPGGDPVLLSALRDWIAYHENTLREGQTDEDYKS
jgi:anti-sigma regulatory factor (Ser/Thr protein kinase)